MKTSELKLGDRFIFLEGQRIKYIIKGGNFSEMDSNSVITYEVLKKNEKSFKCMQIGGRIEYTIKFAGFYDRVVLASESLVEIIN